MSSPALPNEPWEAVEVGEDLGSLDYVMTAEMIADYRRVVDNPHAAYPTVAARHPANLFYRRYRAQLRVPNTGHDSEILQSAAAGEADQRQCAHRRQVYPSREAVSDHRGDRDGRGRTFDRNQPAGRVGTAGR